MNANVLLCLWKWRDAAAAGCVTNRELPLTANSQRPSANFSAHTERQKDIFLHGATQKFSTFAVPTMPKQLFHCAHRHVDRA